MSNGSNPKYPFGLFFTGFIMNVLIGHLYLLLPAIILLIIGIRNKTCLLIGLVLLALNILISFIKQLQNRRTLLSPSDNPDFTDFQKSALSSDWRENVMSMVEEKISDQNEE